MSTKVEYIQVPSTQKERRLDNFLLSKLKGVPKSHIYSIIRSGEVRINSKRAKADTRLQTDDKIRIPPIRTAQRQEKRAQPELIQQVKDAILFQDDNIIAINKPRWLGSHGGVNRPFGIIEVLHQIFSSKEIYLAHRLDLETTGVLLIARNLEVLRQINQTWHGPDCHKIYLAIVHGAWPYKNKKITTQMSKGKVGGEYIMQVAGANSTNKERTAEVADRGKDKEAITKFTLMPQTSKVHKDHSLLRAELLTGRTHQIRLQCATAGYPVVGDRKYSFLATSKSGSEPKRQELALHCWQIALPLPLKNKTNMSSKKYEIVATPPAVFGEYNNVL